MTTQATHQRGTTLSALIADRSRHHGSRIAIIGEAKQTTFSDLAIASQRLAAAFSNHGIGRGDCVAIWMPNSVEWLACFFGLAQLGARVMSCNTRFRVLEIKDVLERSHATAVIMQPQYRGIEFGSMLESALAQLDSVTSVFTLGTEAASTTVGRPSYRLEDLARTAPLEGDLSSCDDIGLMLTTSGTTRRPKLVMHRQAALVEHAADVADAMGYTRDNACAYNALPFCGTFGLIQALACIHAGAPMVMHSTFDADAARAAFTDNRVTLAAMTDEMIRRTFAATTVAHPFPGVRLFTGSRAQQLVPLADERGFTMIGLYGSSEVHGLFARGLDSEPSVRRTQGGGHPVSSRARVRATDVEHGTVLPHGEPGHLEFLTPTLFAGYYGDDDATKAAFTADGWFRSGDLGTTSEDGSFHYLSRINDSLRLKGFLVNPVEIEAFIDEIEGVELSQVVGVDAADGQPCAIAFYTTTHGRAIDRGLLLARCNEGLAPFKVPTLFAQLDRFPTVSSVNAIKIDRVELRRQAAQLLRPDASPDASR